MVRNGAAEPTGPRKTERTNHPPELETFMLMTADLRKTNPNVTVEDPLEHDRPEDSVLMISRRALCRVAYVAAETASRFEREGIEVDPMAWMLTPRALFDGASALDACVARTDFTRAILLHGLSLGLDASPDAIDALGGDDDDDFDAEADSDLEGADDDDFLVGGGYAGAPAFSALHRHEPRLFSATVDVDRGGSIRHGFHASMARSIGEFRGRVASIFGYDALQDAVCSEGINPSVRMVEGLVAPDLLETLVAAELGRVGRGVAVTAERVVELDA